MDELLTETDEPTRPSRSGAELEVGASIGRYRITGRLGAGGMGEVYATHDPELDRHVAVKVLARSDEAAMAQLIREARAVARLSHDNVIAVFDVGTHAGRVFLAMELVLGETLRAWMQRGEPSLGERLAVLIAAGRGLQAAHDAGIVHGDFKPDNVLIGRDQGDAVRPRVIDFGLARELVHDSTLSDPEHSRDADRTNALGTLAYMPPEQHRRAVPEPRSDQFAFCVTAWEVLFGVRPFLGETAAALVTAILDGRIEPPPRGAGVPIAVRNAIRRGLAVDPRDRWPTMELLLHELRPRSLRRRVLIGAAVLATTAGLGWLAVREPTPLTSCEPADSPVHGVWNAETRAHTISVLGGLSDVSTHQLADAAEQRIDRWAESWTEAYVSVCQGLRNADSDWAGSTAAGKLCLEQRLAQLEAVVAILGALEASSYGHVNAVLTGLSSVGDCTDAVALEAVTAHGPPPDPEQLERLFGEIARATALGRAGHHPEASAMLDAIADAVAAADWLPLTIELDLARSRLPPDGETLEAAIDRVDAAFARALAAHADAPAAELALDLAWQFGMRGSDYERAAQWLARARATTPEIGGAATRISADNIEGALHSKRGDYQGAHAAFARALALAEQAGMGTLSLVSLHGNLVRAEFSMGRMDEALARIERVRRDYPLEPGSYRDLELEMLRVTALRLRGDLTVALPAYEALAARLDAAALSDESPRVDLLQGLAITALELRRLDRAIATRGELVALYERIGDAQNLAIQLIGLAEAKLLAAHVGPELDAAEALATRAMVLDGGDEVTLNGSSLRARAALRRGDPDKAREHLANALERAATAQSNTRGVVDAHLVGIELGEAIGERDAVRRSIVAAEARAPLVADRGRLPRIWFALALARWRIHFDRTRARELVVQADEQLRAHPGDPALAIEIRDWLAAHP